jgi:integrase/recombinase XerD
VNATLPALIDTLVAARRAGGFRYDKQERVLRQFAGHCRREGYADGSIVREAVEEFLYGVHRPQRGDRAARAGRARPPVRLAGVGAAGAHAREGPAPAAALRVQRRRGPPPVPRYRHPAAVGGVEQGAGRPGAVPGALLHRHAPVRGARPGTARLRPGPRDPRGARREERTLPVTARLAATLDTYITAAHPQPGPSCKLFHTGDPTRPPDKSTAYNRFRRYLADADIPHFPGGPHIHSLRHGFAVANLRRWASAGADLAVMLPYLSAYMGHADLRGTQYYLRLTADAYPEVAAMAAARFGYVIPDPAALQGRQR